MSYAYASGNIKALETKVYDKNKLFVLSKYEKNEFVKVLTAMNYGENSLTIEEAISKEMAKTKEIIDSLTPDKDSTNLFYLINDAQNIKILYKMKNFHLDRNEFLQDNGSINNQALLKAINDNDYSELSRKEANLIKDLNKDLEGIDNPKVLSTMIDQKIYQYARKTMNIIMKHFISVKLDVTNIISLLRARNLHWEKEKYQEMFIDGGKIPLDILMNIYEENKDSIIKTLEVFYEEKISKILKKTIDHFEMIEVTFEKFVLEEMAAFKDDAFSIGPMLYYYLLKQAEAQNIRILYSKKNSELKDLI